MKTFILIILFLGFSQLSVAQNSLCTCPDEEKEHGWCWGKDPKTAKEKNVMYIDAKKLGDNKAAAGHIEWLLENTPCLNKSIYINGVKIYETLVKSEVDETMKIKYQDRVLDLYDVRIKNFGEEAKVLQRKGNRAYPYLHKRKGVDFKALFDLYKKIFELNGKETNRYNVATYMVLAGKMKRKKVIDENQLLDIYDHLAEVVEYNIAKNDKNLKKWEKTHDAIDAIVAPIIDCDFVRSHMGEGLKTKPDIKQAKRALKHLIRGGCTDDPLFLIAAEFIFEKEPTIGLAVTIGKIYLKQKNYKTSLEWYNKGIGLSSEDIQKKAELHLDVAKVNNLLGKKNEARKNALKAYETDPTTKKEVYTMIGNLYMGSGKFCEGKNSVENRYCYLAAFDAYQKAGNADKMAKAKEQFPSITDIFTLGMKEGSTVDVGCWIGGKTTLRRRPK